VSSSLQPLKTQQLITARTNPPEPFVSFSDLTEAERAPIVTDFEVATLRADLSIFTLTDDEVDATLDGLFS
jgi:hypothetical protein